MVNLKTLRVLKHCVRNSIWQFDLLPERENRNVPFAPVEKADMNPVFLTEWKLNGKFRDIFIWQSSTPGFVFSPERGNEDSSSLQ